MTFDGGIEIDRPIPHCDKIQENLLDNGRWTLAQAARPESLAQHSKRNPDEPPVA